MNDMAPNSIRIGHGYDLHRLQRGGELVVGGVIVTHGISAVAHSDGDVAIHALVDAILGALGDGDIGEHFPDTDPAWKGAPSIVFLTTVLKRAHDRGYRVANADITVQAERPKLKPFKANIVRLLSETLQAPVNLKAGTNEGCDAVGRGEAIAAHAVVLLIKAG
jgi:2-C-methyl-D-erythritol 2,4-cyclodiphosphate synthase